MIGRACQFDFSGTPPPADWIVHGLVERGAITVLSADSGSGKSLLSASFAVAIIQQKPWLGRATSGQRCMVVDEENNYRVVAQRLYGLGLTNDDRPHLRYFLRVGVQLGANDWAERVREEMDDFRPDLLIVDTAAAATNVELNDNSSVAKLYASSLRPLAEDAAVLLLHHERKPQQGARRHAGHAMMGARQWAGQADAHLALKALSDKPQVETLPDGGLRRTYRLELEMPKNRDGQGASEKVAIVSEHDEGTTVPRWLRVEKAR